VYTLSNQLAHVTMVKQHLFEEIFYCGPITSFYKLFKIQLVLLIG